MPSSLLVWSVGDRNPSITDTITVGGSPFNLSSSTVVFKMRAVGSSTLKVNASAVKVSPQSNGVVRYDWAADDVDTAGTYLVWWEVTTSGNVQSVNEQIIEIRDHGPAALPGYVELEAMKKTLSLDGTSFSDLDIKAAIQAASRSIDNECSRRFYPDPDNTTQMVFPGNYSGIIEIEDCFDIQAVGIDTTGTGSYSYAWTSQYYIPGPYNAPLDSSPYEWLEARANWAPWPTVGTGPAMVRVTGQFGWSAVPAPIVDATSMLAHRLLRRKREAPFAIQTLGADSGTGARGMRISQTDPDVAQLLQPYVKGRPFA